MVNALMAVMIWFTVVHLHLAMCNYQHLVELGRSSMSYMVNLLQIESTGYDFFDQSEALKVMPAER